MCGVNPNGSAFCFQCATNGALPAYVNTKDMAPAHNLALFSRTSDRVHEDRHRMSQAFEFCDECGMGEYAMERLGHAKLCENCHEQAKRSAWRGTVVHMRKRSTAHSGAKRETR